MSFTNLSKLELSRNKIKNYECLVSNIKLLKTIQELNLIENDFNREFYSDDLVESNGYNCIFDYYESLFDSDKNQKLIDYRSFIIFKLPQLQKLDMIYISDKERKVVFDEMRTKNFMKNERNVKNTNKSIEVKNTKINDKNDKKGEP